MTSDQAPNPLRALASSARPYLRQIPMSDRRLRQHFIHYRDHLNQRLAHQLAELSARVDGELAAARQGIESYLDAARSDALALNHRMAGLEVEAAQGEDARARADAEFTQLHAQVQELTAYVRALHGDFLAARQPDSLEPVSAGLPSGRRIWVQPQDLIGSRILGGQEWEPYVRAAIEAAADPARVAVDAGASIGVHTLTMAAYFREVHAFEPQPEVAGLLRRTLADNGVTNVVVHEAALFDHETRLHLAPAESQQVDLPMVGGRLDYGRITNAAALAFVAAADGVDDPVLDVPAVALDDLDLADVALIKIDTQGCDLEVLHGSRETLRRDRPTVVFEYESELAALQGDTLAAYTEFLDSVAYDVELLHEGNPGRQAEYLARPRPE